MAELSNHIAAESRESFGKGAARKLRATGRIPAVIYGHGTEPRHVSLPGHQTSLLLRKANAIIELSVDGKDELTLVKDVQRDPVRQIIEHMDLVVIKKGERVHVEVPVHVEGESAPGTTALQDAVTIRIEVEAIHIPERIVLSIEGLELGSHITAGDVELPTGATLVDDPELLLLAVNAMTVAAAAEDTEADEPTAAAKPAAEEPAE